MLSFPQRSQDEKDELRAENGQIFHCLQNSLTSANLASFFAPLHLHQVLIYGTYVLPWLQQFWNDLQKELVQKKPYAGGMRLKLHKLQAEDKQARKLRADQQLGQQGWEDIDGMLHYQSLPYVSEIIRTELINRHYDKPLAGLFGIEKIHELVAQK